jgi:hypothetical protein
MSRRSKSLPQWPRRSEGLLEPWASSSDRVLHAVLHSEEVSLRFDHIDLVESERERRAPTSIDDQMAIAVLSLLGMSGVVIGWAIFV